MHSLAELGHEDPERREAEQRRLLNLEGGLAIAEAAALVAVEEEARARLQRILRMLRATPGNALECWSAFVGACSRRDVKAFWRMISIRGRQSWIDDITGYDFVEVFRHDGRPTENLCKRVFGLELATLRRMSYEEVALVLVKGALEDDEWVAMISDVELISWSIEPDRMLMTLKFPDIEDAVTLPWYVEDGVWTIDLNAAIRWK